MVFFKKAMKYPGDLNNKGKNLNYIANNKYAIEHMALKHVGYFENILNRPIKG